MFGYPVRYNGYDLNTVVAVEGGKRYGCLLEAVDYGRSAGIGYTEKRAQDDGLDASDVYMGARYISLAGTVYGVSEADTHDRLQSLRRALTPTIAYAFDEDDYGYIPLEFTLPSLMSQWQPTGTRPVEFRARPTGQPQFSLRRDGGSGAGESTFLGSGVPWQVTLECKDPRMYLRPETTKNIYFGTGQLISNRGDYPAPLGILLSVVASPANGNLHIEVGGSIMNIKLPSLTNSVVRYSGELKVLTLQTPVDETDVLRMDLLSFESDTTHPKVPVGSTTLAVTITGATELAGGGASRFIFSESFA